MHLGHQPVGFSQNPHERLSVLSFTGLQRAVLIQTGNDRNGLFGPQKSFNKHFSSVNGTLAGFRAPVDYLDLRGGVLSEIGPVITSTVVTDGRYGWFVVGGSGGIAVLANPDGTGWPLDDGGLQSGFRHLSSSMRFIKIGKFKKVHKLIGIDDKLFVVGLHQFSRINVSPHQICAGNDINTVTLLEAGSVENRALLDAVIVQGLAVVATNAGMIHTGLGVNIQTTNSEAEAHWQQVAIPYSTGGVTRFQLISSSTFNAPSNLYVLDASPANGQARIYRYVVDPTSHHPLILFPDKFTQDQPRTFFVNLGIYKSYLYTNGAALYLTGSPFARGSLNVGVITQNLRSGHHALQDALQKILVLRDAKAIGTVLQDPGSGSMVVWTDTQLLVNG